MANSSTTLMEPPANPDARADDGGAAARDDGAASTAGSRTAGETAHTLVMDLDCRAHRHRAAAGYLVWRHYKTPAADATAAATRTPGRRRCRRFDSGRGRPGPQGDIDVHYTGLGSGRPDRHGHGEKRVDGQLMSVGYKEGDLVHQETRSRKSIRVLPGAVDARAGHADQGPGGVGQRENRPWPAIRRCSPKSLLPEQTVATQQALVTQDEGVQD